MLLTGCASEPNVKTITVTKSNCLVVPYLDLSDEEIDALVEDIRLHPLIIRIDKQNRILDVCNGIEDKDEELTADK